MEYRLRVTDEVYAAAIVTNSDITKRGLQQASYIAGWKSAFIIGCGDIGEFHTLRIHEGDAVQIEYADSSYISPYP